MSGYVEARTAKHTVVRIGWVVVRRSHDPPLAFQSQEHCTAATGKPSAVEDSCGCSFVERVVPVSIPPHHRLDDTFIGNSSPQNSNTC